MMRLIIFIVVVLPHPDGPTKTTISPSYTSSVRLSTAGSEDPGKVLVNSSSRIMTFLPEPLLLEPALLSLIAYLSKS